MRREDWLLAQLPVGMLDDDFFVRFMGIFQQVGSTLLDSLDNLANTVDCSVAPEPMLRYLASWIGVDAIDPSLPHPVQREIVRASARILSWRGTRRGLQQFLELISGGPAVVEEGGGVYAEGEAPAGSAWARLRVQSTGWMTERDFVQLVRDEVPAHVRLELFVGDRCVAGETPAVRLPEAREMSGRREAQR